MYAVVGCSECGALWVLEDDPATSQCPRCGSRRPRHKRRQFFTTADADAAREARSRLLADRQDAGEVFEGVDDFAALDDVIDAAGPDDETYLSASGLDPDEIAEAGERATAPRPRRSNEETVRAAVRELESPDEAAIVSYCKDRGVEPAAATKLLNRLEQAGEVTQQGDGYRPL